MNKGMVIVGIVILVLVGGGLYVANQQSKQAEQAKMAQEKAAMKAKEDAATEEKKAMEKKATMEKGDTTKQDGATMKKDGARYVEYSKTDFDGVANKRRVLYFYASWCPICRPTDAEFKANGGKIPEDVVVLRVNYNDPDTDQEEKDLAKKYAVTYQHTFVQVDGQGKDVTKWNGGAIDKLLSSIK